MFSKFYSATIGETRIMEPRDWCIESLMLKWFMLISICTIVQNTNILHKLKISRVFTSETWVGNAMPNGKLSKNACLFATASIARKDGFVTELGT